MSITKFERTLSADSGQTLSSRSANIKDSLVLEAERYISDLQRERVKLIARENDLTDLAPENTYSLRPGGPKFDPAKWFKEMHEIKLELQVKDLQIKAAKEINDEWLTPESEDESKA